MRLNRIVLSNFRQHADTRIDFDAGLTGIIGPNGSGKTTVLEALAWAIYGNTAARGTRESIRFNRAAARATVRVELDFELAGHRYRVVRGLTNAELYLDGAATPIANSISGVTDILTRKLGMTRDEFFNTYFTGQKDLSVMAAMKPAERAQFLSHVLGYERLRDAQKILRGHLTELRSQIIGIQQGMPDADVVGKQLEDARRRLASTARGTQAARDARGRAQAVLDRVRPKWELAQREREALQALLAELRVAEGEEAGLARDAERLARELGGIAAAKAERDALATELIPYAALHAEFQHLEVLAREDGRRQSLVASRALLEDELAKLHERRARLDTAPRLEEEATLALHEKRASLEELDGKVEARRTEWVRDRQEAETKRQALRDQYAELKQQRDRLAAAGEDGACPTCARPLKGTMRTVLELLDGQLETVLVDGNYYKGRMEQLLEMPADLRELDERRRVVADDVKGLERRLFKVQHAVQELAQLGGEIAAKSDRVAALRSDLETIPAGYDPVRHDLVRRELDRLMPLDAKATRLSAQIEREPALLRERAQLHDAEAALRARVTDLRARQSALNVSEQLYAALRDEHTKASDDMHAADLAAATAESELASAELAEAQARRAAAELAERLRLLGELNVRKRLHEELDRAYTDLRNDLNFQLRPELSELASGFLNDLTGGRYTELELDDQYNVVVLEDAMPKPVISGGEEDLANLVLRLAISQMIAERSGQPFSLLVLDEIFGSLDDAHRASVLELLRGLHDRFEQVILITHIESVRDMLDQVVTVRYDAATGASVATRDDRQPLDVGDLKAPELAGAGAAD
ncbi:MAG TPA: SMC family ATPase [Gemmatimonadaceae bacterium]|nr:SMC family ATPase [Gemmatimonadaceae bacterium]